MKHVVQAGENPATIAQMYTGDPWRFSELVAENPQIPTEVIHLGTVGAPAVRTFEVSTFVEGTELNLPRSWACKSCGETHQIGTVGAAKGAGAIPRPADEMRRVGAASMYEWTSKVPGTSYSYRDAYSLALRESKVMTVNDAHDMDPIPWDKPVDVLVAYNAAFPKSQNKINFGEAPVVPSAKANPAFWQWVGSSCNNWDTRWKNSPEKFEGMFRLGLYLAGKIQKYEWGTIDVDKLKRRWDHPFQAVAEYYSEKYPNGGAIPRWEFDYANRSRAKGDKDARNLYETEKSQGIGSGYWDNWDVPIRYDTDFYSWVHKQAFMLPLTPANNKPANSKLASFGFTGAANKGLPTSPNSAKTSVGRVPWGTMDERRTDDMPGLKEASWNTINPHSGEAMVQGPVKRVLKILDNKKGGFSYLGGWTKSQVLTLIESWVRETWETPWAMVQTIPEAEEEVGYLFVSWLLGWNVTFSGRRWQPCEVKWVKLGEESHSIGPVYQNVPTGYVWDPYRRTCVEAGTQMLSRNGS